jgi:Flp pilus assembly protein TadG
VHIYPKQRGAAAVELAILLVPLVLLAFGITEFGRAIYQYNALTKATRDAARFLSERGTDDPGDVTTARCLAVYGNRTCTGNPLAPNLTTAMVTVCDKTSCPGAPDQHQSVETGSGVVDLVSVRVTAYPFTSLVPFVVPSMTFPQIGTTMRL